MDDGEYERAKKYIYSRHKIDFPANLPDVSLTT